MGASLIFLRVSPVGGNNNRPLRKRLPSWKRNGSEAFFDPWVSEFGLAWAGFRVPGLQKNWHHRGVSGGKGFFLFVSACIHCKCY